MQQTLEAPAEPKRVAPGQVATAGLVLAPAALALYLGLNSGGFFPGATGTAAVALLVLLAARAVLADRPFEGLGWSGGLAAGALALLAAWTLASALWSDAPARALLEYDRTLLYLATVLLLGSLAYSERRARVALAGVVLAATAICAVAFIVRTLPETFPVDTGIVPKRMAYPLGYWNALGLLAGFALLGCTHLTASDRVRGAGRVLAAAALPLLGAALLLTFSRGAIVATIGGLLLYACAARSRLLVTGLAATAVPTAVALVATYRADLLASDRPTSAAAADQGADLALIVLAAALAAGILRWCLLRVDWRLARASWRQRPWLARGVAGTLAVAAVVAFFVGDGPSELSRQYDNFVEGDTIPAEKQRERLTQIGNNGRLGQWDVGLEAAAAEPLRGVGAGGFATLWTREREGTLVVHDGHSLYVEAFAELGAVGLGLLLAAIVALVVGVARRTRGGDRPLAAAVLALTCTWAVHAGVDWDWEMPVLGAPLLGLCALMVARPPGEGRRPPGGMRRVVPALGFLVLAIAPASVAISQNRLNESVRAFRAGDCERSISLALDSAAAVPVRPEPFQLLGFCDARLGRHELAERVMRNAVRLDPDNWEFRYSLAIVLAAAGRDPRPELEAALALDPRSRLLRTAERRFATNDRAVWQRRARGAPLPFQR
jgi:hypothetical protein